MSDILPIHPRTCGEKFCIASASSLSVDSSPHLRGKVAICISDAENMGFIPAPAGKSYLPVNLSCLNQIHPRTCGEKVCAFVSLIAVADSSPRLRGKAQNPGLRFLVNGFIPAPAGKREQPGKPARKKQIHPRACEEKCFCSSAAVCLADSSPRLRGKVYRARKKVKEEGFIPAPARKRLSVYAAFRPLWYAVVQFAQFIFCVIINK